MTQTLFPYYSNIKLIIVLRNKIKTGQVSQRKAPTGLAAVRQIARARLEIRNLTIW